MDRPPQENETKRVLDYSPAAPRRGWWPSPWMIATIMGNVIGNPVLWILLAGLFAVILGFLISR